MAIPSKITKQHILKALSEIDKTGVPANRQSDRYFLEYKEHTYPPKFVISVAHKHAFGVELDPNPKIFNTYQAQRFLKARGFDIIEVDQHVDDSQEGLLFKYPGFKLISLNLEGNQYLGSNTYNFIESNDDLNKIYTTVIIGPNGTGKSNLFRVIIDLFKEINDLKNGKVRSYTVKGEFNLRFSLNGDIYEFTNFKDPRALDLSKDEKYNYAYLFRNNRYLSFSNAQLPLAIIANSIMVTDKYPVYRDESTFPQYKYLGVRTTPQSVSTRSYIRKTVEFITKEKDSSAFRKGLTNLTKFLGINKAIDISYETINAPTFFNGELKLQTLKTFFNSMEDRYQGSEYPPQKLQYYHRISDNNEILNAICVFCNKVYHQDRLLIVKKGSSVRKITYNIIDEQSFQLLRRESEMIEQLRQLGIVTTPEISLRSGESYSLQESSSGEYHFFSSMVGLMATVKTNSLIFLDEPEISLHPNWQMKYLSFIHELFSEPEYKTCHLIVATHSHFILSDLKGETSKIIALKKVDSKINIINFAQNTDTYGWSAEDVLYNVFDVASTRNYYVAKEIGEILKIIGRKKIDKQMLIAKKDELSYIKSKLKFDDPLRSLIIKVEKEFLN